MRDRKLDGASSGSQSINDIHDEGIVDFFVENIGNRAFVLTEAFPFMFIGKILNVFEDVAVLDVETTSVAALENREWSIHIHSIEVFFIEGENGPRIPQLK